MIASEMQNYPEIGIEWKESGLAFRVTFIKKNKQNKIMKTKHLLLLTLIFVLQSCSTFYQVYEVNSNNVTKDANSLTYKDSVIKINYNFWAEGGYLNFTVFNNTDRPIYIDFTKCHFINDNQSFDFSNNEEKTYTNQITAKNPGTNKIVTQSVIIKKSNAKIIEIPPKSYIPFEIMNITDLIYVNCNNRDKPKYKTPIIFNYNEKVSPIFFRNYLTLSFNSNLENPFVIDNSFWVETIYNITQSDFNGKQGSEKNKCGEIMPSSSFHYEFPYYKPFRFYLKTTSF